MKTVPSFPVEFFPASDPSYQGVHLLFLRSFVRILFGGLHKVRFEFLSRRTQGRNATDRPYIGKRVRLLYLQVTVRPQACLEYHLQWRLLSLRRTAPSGKPGGAAPSRFLSRRTLVSERESTSHRRESNWVKHRGNRSTLLREETLEGCEIPFRPRTEPFMEPLSEEKNQIFFWVFLWVNQKGPERAVGSLISEKS